MKQQHSPALGSSPEATDLTLNLTSAEADELIRVLKSLAVLPENDDDFPAPGSGFSFMTVSARASSKGGSTDGTKTQPAAIAICRQPGP
jgi:hypothetical protein